MIKMLKNYFLAVESAFAFFSALSLGEITFGRFLSEGSAFLSAGADVVVAVLFVGFVSTGLSAATATTENIATSADVKFLNKLILTSSQSCVDVIIT